MGEPSRQEKEQEFQTRRRACGESPLIKAGGRYGGVGCKLEKWVGLCASEHLPNNRIHRVRKEQC